MLIRQTGQYGLPHPQLPTAASIASIRACVRARVGFHYPIHSAVSHPSSSCKQRHNAAPQAVDGEGQGSHPEGSAWQEPLPLGAGAILVRGVQVVGTLLKLWLLHQNKHDSTSSAQVHASSSSSDGQDSYSATVQQLISNLGPLWVKLGQTLAVRPDVVGDQLAGALSGLQESAPPFPSDTAAAILQEELCAPPHELFARWSARPVASASLGQVYQAELADGRLVAVKVQRPGTWAQIALDLSILTQLLRLLRWAGRIKQDITQWATTLGQGLAQELDYQQEARNLTEFAVAHSYLGFVDTPHVIWPLTTTRILTTTWVEGQTPGQILRCLRSSTSQAAGMARKPRVDSKPPSSTSTEDAALQQQLLLLVDLGIQATLHQLVVTGVLHADPHPGNLLLSDGKLVFLDFGLLLCLPQETSLAMMAALLHWSQANWLGLAADMRQMGLLKPSIDLQELAADLQLRFERLYADSIQQSAGDNQSSIAGSAGSTNGSASTLLARAGAIGFAEFAGVVAALALKYRFELPPYYTLVIRSLTTLEGFALVVDPSARYSIARTAVKVVARQLLYDKRPAARKLLQEVLVLQDASGQSGAQRLNLQLLEELLQLSVQHTLPTAAAGNAPQSQAGGPTSGSWQAVDPIAFCQEQLGLPIQLVAAQLSSPEAASVRAMLAQQLVSRLVDRRVLEDVLNEYPDIPRLGVSPVVSTAGGCGTTGPVAGGKRETGRTVLVHAGGEPRVAPSKAKTMHGWLAVLVGAGVGGAKLVAQLVCLVLAMLMARAVVWVQQRIRQLLQWVV